MEDEEYEKSFGQRYGERALELHEARHGPNPEAGAELARRDAVARGEHLQAQEEAKRDEALRADRVARAGIAKQLYDMGVPVDQVDNLKNLTPEQLSAVKTQMGIIQGPYLDESQRGGMPETLLMPPPESPYFEDVENEMADRETALRDEYAGLFGQYHGRLGDIRNRTRGAADAERLSAEASSAANVARLEEEGKARGEFREEYRELAKQQEVASRIRRESKDKARRDIDDAVSEVTEMRINPNRMFHNTSSRVVAAIAAGLGEFGRQLRGGGTNTALQIINSAIDRDIDAQKQAIRTAEVGVRMQENSYKRLLDLHGDDERAELLTRQQALSFAKMKIGEITDRYKVPLEKSKLSGLIAGIDKGLLQTELSLADKEFNSRVAEMKLRPVAKPVKFTKDEASFFRMFNDFRTGLHDLKDMYRGTGKYKGQEPMKGSFTRILSEKAFGKQGVISGAGRTLGTRAAEFFELGARLSKSFSEIKEAGKISDMDLIFYLERVPLPDDADNIIEAKIAALDEFQEKAMDLRLGLLSPAAFKKANKLIQGKMSAQGLTTVSPEERSRLIKQLYGKEQPGG